MNHWLVKSEPSVYSWDNLLADKRTNWNGVRNFQASKNLTAGEGGAILTSNEELAERCYAGMNNSRARKVSSGNGYLWRGANLRMSEFHAGLLGHGGSSHPLVSALPA